MMIITMGCTSEKTRNWLRSIVRQMTLQNRRESQIHSLGTRIGNCLSRTGPQDAAQKDSQWIEQVKKVHEYNNPQTKDKLYRTSVAGEQKRNEKLPTKLVEVPKPALYIHDQITSRVAIQC